MANSGSNSFIYLDISEISKSLQDGSEEVKEKLDGAARLLAAQAHAHIIEKANAKLHTRRKMFVEGVHWEPMDDGVYAVTIDANVRWIEDGMQPHNMLEDLLSGPKAKTSKDGKSKYVIVPFKHDGGPTQQTPTQQVLLKAIKSELRKRKIPYKKLEVNPDGSPKLGLLHSFDLDTPKQQHKVKLGHQGPQGKAYHTNPVPPGQMGPHGLPWLWATRVYQKQKKDAEGNPVLRRNGDIAVERNIFTFRVASSKQQGKWWHPGLAPMNFMEDAYEWAKNEWDNNIGPEVLRSLNL